MPKLHDLPGSARLAIGGFTGLILFFALLAQANLWLQAGAGSLPSPQQILERYHGRPDSSKLHVVLDPSLPDDDPKAMYGFLGDTPEVRATNRETVLAWVDAGAPASGWADVEPIIASEERCAQCHYPGGQADHLPLETYEQVLVTTKLDDGMPMTKLLQSAHAHMFGFATLSLLLSLLLCMSRFGGLLRVALIVAAFLGPALDIGGWLLTKHLGAPFHWTVLVGGGLFGGATATMAGLVLLDLLRGGARGGGHAARATS